MRGFYKGDDRKAATMETANPVQQQNEQVEPEDDQSGPWPVEKLQVISRAICDNDNLCDSMRN